MDAAVSRQDRLLDLLLALAGAVLAVSSVLTTDPSVAYDYPPANAWLVLLALVTSLPLAFRRVFPFTVLAVSLAGISTIMLLRWNEGVAPLCTLAALYALAVYQQRRVAVAGLALVLGAFSVFTIAGVPHFDNASSILNIAVFCVPWIIGLAVRHQRVHREAATARAIEAERGLAVAQERAVFAERLRIAREMHDVVSHTLSIVTVQAGVARHLLAQDPQQAGPALSAIEEASRTALDDLRRMLGVLRTPADQNPADELAPAPGLAELDRLALTHRETHGPVELLIDSVTQHAPDSVRLTVYRIVQEALTNVRKHAPHSAVRIDIRAIDGDVTVEVDNDATATQGVSADNGGFGLVGMRERVGLFGGYLESGPTTEGGFRLRAVLPGVANHDPVRT